ncbi:MAG: enolase C-terminal domain-like protein [Gammaproteobacteria bacterium WSBS_2016_MAG_OTU1]
MKIVELREKTALLKSDIRNAVITFSRMNISLVAVVTDCVQDGKPVIGYGLHSNGRYAQGGILRERLFPRVLDAAPEEYNEEKYGLDPIKLSEIAMRGEKPGGHGDRAVAAAALDMAIWDAASKIAGIPLWQMIAERFNNGQSDKQVMVYPGGGYYFPGKNLQKLKDEMRGYIDNGYRMVKMKIGGAPLKEDMRRVDAVIAVAGGAEYVAVDANGGFDLPKAMSYADALRSGGFFWFEEPLDPLDFQGHAVLSEYYSPPLATGENIFSWQDARNLLRHGGLRPDRDWIQMDPGLAGGLSEYIKMVRLFQSAGWTTRRFVPHGGHQFALNIVAGLQLGACESYPGVFQPYGGFADNFPVENGFVRLPDAPGIGMELKQDMFTEVRRLLET